MKNFNLNQTVKAKINPTGIEQWVKHYMDCGFDEANARKTVGLHINKDGYASLQLHDLMYLFGKELYIANNTKLPISMEIQIDENHLTDIKQPKKLKTATVKKAPATIEDR